MLSLRALNPLQLLLGALLVVTTFAPVSAYQVLISDHDEIRQVCSGMWGKGKQEAFIEGMSVFPIEGGNELMGFWFCSRLRSV